MPNKLNTLIDGYIHSIHDNGLFVKPKSDKA